MARENKTKSRYFRSQNKKKIFKQGPLKKKLPRAPANLSAALTRRLATRILDKSLKPGFSVTQLQCPSVDLIDYLQKIFNVLLRSQKVKVFHPWSIYINRNFTLYRTPVVTEYIRHQNTAIQQRKNSPSEYTPLGTRGTPYSKL